MKKPILCLTVVSVILFSTFSFAKVNKGFTKIVRDVPAYSSERQKQFFQKYLEATSKNETLLPNLGYLYYYGYGTAEDRTTAVNIYKRAASQDDDMGMYLLGKYYIEDMNDTQQGLSYLIRSADKGNYLAAEFIAKMYEEGKYVKADNYYSLEYYHMASKLGSSSARFVIAQQLLQSGDESNYPKGMEYLRAAADLSNIDACKTLAKLYITENKVVAMDSKKHVVYTMCAADEGDIESIKTLADYYSRGVIVMIDNSKATKYYNDYIDIVQKPKTAEEADMFYKAGVVQSSINNFRKAGDYFKISARAGNADSAIALARMFEMGYGVKQDFPMALTYYKMAQKNGKSTSEDIMRIQRMSGGAK